MPTGGPLPTIYPTFLPPAEERKEEGDGKKLQTGAHAHTKTHKCGAHPVGVVPVEGDAARLHHVAHGGVGVAAVAGCGQRAAGARQGVSRLCGTS